MRTLLCRLCLGLLLATPLSAFSQDAKDDIKKAGTETKEAAKDTGRATKKAAKKTGHADMPAKCPSCDQDWATLYGAVRDFRGSLEGLKEYDVTFSVPEPEQYKVRSAPRSAYAGA